MVAEIQSLCVAMGAGACYEFSIMCASEVETGRSVLSPINVHADWLSNGMIKADCTVLQPGACMQSLAGGKWIVLKAGDGVDSSKRPYDLPLDYTLKPGEHDIARYEWLQETEPGHQHLWGHFFYAGPGPLWDSFGMSNTRKYGSLVSRRIFRRA